MNRFLSVFCAVILLSVASASAQKVISDSRTSLYVISDNETIKEAELNAVMQAQLEMIADHFGTVVGVTNFLSVTESSSRNITFGETEVKGEWIETTKKPILTRSVKDGLFVIEATVFGKIREIISTPIDLKCKVLKNGDDDRFESNSFNHGDYLCLSFQTPTDGYLTVYLTDRNMVQCLYPYKAMSSDDMLMKADQRYVLFSKKTPGDVDPNRIPRMRLGCVEEVEYNRIYIVFSPNKYVKATDYESEGRPRELTFKDFQSWLSKLRQFDNDMNVRSIELEIRKK